MNDSKRSSRNKKFTSLFTIILAGMVYSAGQEKVPEKKIQASLVANPALAPQIISISPTDMDGMAYVPYQGKFVINGKNFSSDPAKNRIGIRTYTGPNPQIPPPPQEFVAEVIPLTATTEKLEAVAPPITSKGKYWVWVYVEGGGQSNPLAATFAGPVGPSVSGPASGGLISIDGYWTSNVSALYLIRQTGNQFLWDEQSILMGLDGPLLQAGKGTISGKVATFSVTYTSNAAEKDTAATFSGPGTVNAAITEVDALGMATRITCENGVILSRTTTNASPSTGGKFVGGVPAIPSTRIFNISGQWYSSIGAIYEFDQKENMFAWSAPSLNQSGTGMTSERDMVLSGPGWTIKGKITEADQNGKATKIVGDNGVILSRTGLPDAISAGSAGPPIPDSGVFSISGQWYSNIGIVYEFQQDQQDKKKFTWTAPSLNTSGGGTTSEHDVVVNGPGWTIKGRITEADQTGNAIKIVGDNGVILSRAGLPDTMSAGSAGSPVPASGVFNISGQWYSNIGVVYDFQQDKQDQKIFTWLAPSLNQSGHGSTSERDVIVEGPTWARWTIKGKITEADKSGNATKIVGDNGVILSRAGLPDAMSSLSAGPPIPDSGMFDISGQWNSNIGANYEFLQVQKDKKKFTWTAPGLNQSGDGTTSEHGIIMNGPGWTVKGKITEADTSGYATRIVGDNGVILFRTDLKAGASSVPGTPPPEGANIISGKWNSNLGTVFEVHIYEPWQSGNQFAWLATGQTQQGAHLTGAGTISESTVTLDSDDTGWTFKGTITELDSTGKATRIVGEKGLILFRLASIPPAVLSGSQMPAPSSAVSISGEWNSNIGAVYQIQQTLTQFTWSAPSLNQSGSGSISGDAVIFNGPGWTLKGTITEQDVSGHATKIVGENAVILSRSQASSAAVFSVSGQWKGSKGENYSIQQNGNQFTWSAPSLNQSGSGMVMGYMITMNGPGWTIKAMIKDVDASGKATQIIGDGLETFLSR
jgi:hypothetical protein